MVEEKKKLWIDEEGGKALLLGIFELLEPLTDAVSTIQGMIGESSFKFVDSLPDSPAEGEENKIHLTPTYPKAEEVLFNCTEPIVSGDLLPSQKWQFSKISEYEYEGIFRINEKGRLAFSLLCFMMDLVPGKQSADGFISSDENALIQEDGPFNGNLAPMGTFKNQWVIENWEGGLLKIRFNLATHDITIGKVDYRDDYSAFVWDNGTWVSLTADKNEDNDVFEVPFNLYSASIGEVINAPEVTEGFLDALNKNKRIVAYWNKFTMECISRAPAGSSYVLGFIGGAGDLISLTLEPYENSTFTGETKSKALSFNIITFDPRIHDSSLIYGVSNGSITGIASWGRNVMTYDPVAAATLKALETGIIPYGLSEEEMDEVKANIGEEIWAQLEMAKPSRNLKDETALKIEEAKAAFIARKAEEKAMSEMLGQESLESGNLDVEPKNGEKI